MLLILAEKLGKSDGMNFFIYSFSVLFACANHSRFHVLCVGEMCACVGGDEHVHRLLGPLELLATVEESAVREMVRYLMLLCTKINHLTLEITSLLSCLIPLSWKRNFLFGFFYRDFRR